MVARHSLVFNTSGMQKKTILYSVVLVIIGVLAIGLLWLYQYVATQRTALNDTTSSYGYGGGTSGGGINTSWFGGFVESTDSDTAFGTATTTPPRVQLDQIYNLPVAGAALAHDGRIYFTDVASGHVFVSGAELAPKRVLGHTTPKIIDMVLTQNGIVRRYINYDELLTSVYNDFSSETGELLAPGATMMVGNPTGDALFYLVETESGVVGVRYDMERREETPLWRSALTGWVPSWVDDETVLLVQKASSSLPGYALTLNTTSGALTGHIGGIRGLSCIARDDVTVCSRADGADISLLFMQSGATDAMLTLPIKTLAEKCVITHDTYTLYCAVPNELPSGVYPDDWYRGELHFSDTLWSINLETFAAEMVLDPRALAGTSMDMRDFDISDDGGTMLFMNQNNRTPWRITFTQPVVEQATSTNATSTVAQ